MAKFRNGTVVIEAIQWTGFNYTASEVFMGERLTWGQYEGGPGPYSSSCKFIRTLAGVIRCDPGTWIVKDVSGEFYLCEQDIFSKTYEPVIE